MKTKIIILSLTITFLLTACQSFSENTTSVSTTAESNPSFRPLAPVQMKTIILLLTSLPSEKAQMTVPKQRKVNL